MVAYGQRIPKRKFGYRLGEKKSMDTEIDTGSQATPIINSVTTNGDMVALNLVRAGNGYFNRIGRRIDMESLAISAQCEYFYKDQATTHNFLGNWLRICIVYDTQSNSAAIPTFDEIFSHTEQDASESSEVMDPLRVDNMNRFVLLMDERFVAQPQLDNQGAGSENVTKYVFDLKKYIPLFGLRTIYSADSAPMTNTDIVSGSLYIIFRSKEAVTDVAGWSVNGVVRLRYYDA